jgi:hypothetical protein
MPTKFPGARRAKRRGSDRLRVSPSGRNDFEEEAMEQVCLVIPVLGGKGDDARAFMRELERSRMIDYDRSERRIGVMKEVWYLATIHGEEFLIAYIESRDFTRALSSFSASQDEFDIWFKRRLADATGVDLNDPPTMSLPELLSSYSASTPPPAGRS